MTEFRYKILGARAFLTSVGYDRAGADLHLCFGEGVEGTVRLGKRILPLRGGAADFPREALAEGETKPLLFLPGRTVVCTPIRVERGKLVADDEVLAVGETLALLDSRLGVAEKKLAELEERLVKATIL